MTRAHPAVLVTDGDTRAALAATRSLGQRGFPVYVSAPDRHSLATVSRHCTDAFPQATVEAGPRALEQSLQAILTSARPQIVLGITDRALTALHRLGSNDSRIPPPSTAQYSAASSKVELFRHCQEQGLLVPDGIVVAGGELPTEDELRSLGLPFLVRPDVSWRADGEQWVRGSVTIEKDRASLAARLRADPALGFPYLVQRRIIGDGCGLFVLALHGRMSLCFSHRRIREKPPWGGVSTLCESVAPPADLVEVARRYLATTNWSGLAMFEFKRAEGTGEPYLLEINARPWGSLALPAAAGVDFVGGLLDLVLGGPSADPPPYRTGVVLRWWWGDVDHFFLQETAHGRRKASAAVAALWKALRAGPRAEVWDTFGRRDPLPFAVETFRWLLS